MATEITSKHGIVSKQPFHILQVLQSQRCLLHGKIPYSETRNLAGQEIEMKEADHQYVDDQPLL